MTKILKIVAISALAAVLSVGAFAQAAGPQGGGVQNGGQTGGKAGKAGGLKQMQKVEEEVFQKLTPALSADQKAKIEQINQKTKDSAKALREKLKTGDKAAIREEMQKVQTTRRESIQAILNPEQKKSYQALMKAAREKQRTERKKDGGTKVG